MIWFDILEFLVVGGLISMLALLCLAVFMKDRND
jgi:hypothetical protein